MSDDPATIADRSDTVRRLNQTAVSFRRDGLTTTAGVLEKAADHIGVLERKVARLQKRIAAINLPPDKDAKP